MVDNASRRSDYARLLDRAMRLLAIRDHGEQELRRKLTLSQDHAGDEGCHAQAACVDSVIAWCYEQRWLDDARFASHYLNGRSRKGYGPQRIRQELQQKGILREHIDAALNTCEIDWENLAWTQASKRFGEPLPVEYPQKAKVQRFLLYRGFCMEDIQSIWRNFNV